MRRILFILFMAVIFSIAFNVVSPNLQLDISIKNPDMTEHAGEFPIIE